MPEFLSEDGQKIYYELWRAEHEKAVLQILTGLGEMAWYYREFAKRAAKEGYSVYLHEYRCHGRTKADYGTDERNLFVTFALDAGRMREIIGQENPGRKIFLFGHSLGTAVAQIAIKEHTGTWDGLVLMGPSHLDPGEKTDELLKEAGEEAKAYGKDAPSRIIYPALFEGYNAAFKEEKSPYSFITSDKERWDWIASLPFSSPDYSVRFFHDFVLLQSRVIREDALENTDLTDLPVLLLTGSEDMTADHGTYGETKAALLKKRGFKDVTSKVYQGLRHSLLQETKKEEVSSDILAWIGKRAES